MLPFCGGVDAVVDLEDGEARYEEMKNRDLQILSQYPVVEKCISPKDFDAAPGNENK